jgi:hypothetical protein
VLCFTAIRAQVRPGDCWLRLRKLACLSVAVVCLLSSCYFAFVIAPAGLGASAPTVQQGLCPEWFGSREILLRGRDPYSAEATGKIQRAIYGKLAGIDRHNLNQHRFAYPVFFAFLFSPLAVVAFPAAQWLALVGCIAATAFSVGLWLPHDGQGFTGSSCGVFVFAGYPVLLGLQLRQPTLIIAALLAAVYYCVRSNRLVLAGMLAALSTCKPQLAIAFLLPLSIWAIGEWSGRKRFLIATAVGLGGLLAASEWVSPGWLPRWIWTLEAYARYAGSKPLLGDLLRGHFFRPAAVVLAGAVVLVSHKYREQDLMFAVCFSIAAFQLLFPFQIYNEILLVPVALWLAGNARHIQRRGQLHTLLYSCTWIVLGAGWAASVGLSLANLLFSRAGLTLWYLPLLTAWLYPFSVFVTLALYASPSGWWFRGSQASPLLLP